MKPPHIKQKREKEVQRIYKKRSQIWKEMRGLGYVKLKEPIRHGWFKEIVITRKVESYKSKAVILELYDVIEKRTWGRTKEEAHKKWLHQTSKFLIFRDFPTITKKQFNGLSSKAQVYCTPFHYKTSRKNQRLRFYIRIPKRAYRITYSRAYVTHSKKIDPQLESASALLSQQLLKSGYYETDLKMNPWKDDWNLRDQKLERIKASRSLKKLRKYDLNDIIKENISWEIN